MQNINYGCGVLVEILSMKCVQNVRGFCMPYEGFLMRCEVFSAPSINGYTCLFNRPTLVSESSEHGNKTDYTKHMFRLGDSVFL